MTIGDLAMYLKLSKSTLYKLCQEGRVPGQKVGRHWRFHKEVIDRWLMNRADRFSSPSADIVYGSGKREAGN